MKSEKCKDMLKPMLITWGREL